MAPLPLSYRLTDTSTGGRGRTKCLGPCFGARLAIGEGEGEGSGKREAATLVEGPAPKEIISWAGRGLISGVFPVVKSTLDGHLQSRGTGRCETIHSALREVRTGLPRCQSSFLRPVGWAND